MIKRYLRIWWLMTIHAAHIALLSRFGAVIFILGKILRFFLFLLFVVVLVSKTKTIVGYSLWQVIFFYATFNLIDTIAQFVFREVYRFRSYVVSGDFDYFLTKPMSPLFRSLFGGSDVLDFPMLFLSLAFVVVSGLHIAEISVTQGLLYILLLLNAFFIALAFHILVLALGILTTEVDNTLFLYRDLTQMGRLPIDVYTEPIRGFLTFIIPVGIMITFPAKAFMGILSITGIIVSLFVGSMFLFFSYTFWQFSLRHYASASS